MSNEAKAQVQQLRDAELRLEDDLAAARADLAAAREREASAALSAVLDGAGGRKAGEGPATIAERIHALTGAIATARGRRIAAIPAAWAAEAASLREQAAAIEAQAADHEARTRELLEELRAHEGCIFEPRGATRGRLFHVEAAGLEARAAALEVRAVVQSGRIAVDTRDELLAAIRSWPAEKVGPAPYVVADWLDEAEAAARTKVDRLPPDDQERVTRTYRLSWQNGEIVATESAVEVQLPVSQQMQIARPLVVLDRPLPAPRVQEFRLGGASAPPINEPSIRVTNPRPHLVDPHGADVA